MGIIVKNKKPAPEEVQVKHSVATITKAHKDGSLEETKEVIKGQMFDGPTANVGMSIALTKNLGNYESLKITVSLSMPSNPDEASISNTFTEVKSWVDEKINMLNQEVIDQLG